MRVSVYESVPQYNEYDTDVAGEREAEEEVIVTDNEQAKGKNENFLRDWGNLLFDYIKSLVPP